VCDTRIITHHQERTEKSEREREWSCDEEKMRRGNCFVTIFGLLVASNQATKSNDEVVLGQLYSADVIINSLIRPGG
jgi:hypothetical protein